MSGAECEYQPTRDRAAYSRAYVQDLSGRVQALEAMQARLLPLLAAFEGGKLPPDLAARMTAPAQAESEDDRLIRSRLPSPAEDEDEESSRFLTDEHGNYRWIGASSALSLMDQFSGDVRDLPSRVKYGNIHEGHEGGEEESPPESHPYFAPVAGAGVIRAIPGVDQVTFPPRAEAEKMVDAFFAEVHPVLPVLLEHDFRRRFKHLMNKVEAGDFSNIRAGVSFSSSGMNVKPEPCSLGIQRSGRRRSGWSPQHADATVYERCVRRVRDGRARDRDIGRLAACAIKAAERPVAG